MNAPHELVLLQYHLKYLSTAHLNLRLPRDHQFRTYSARSCLRQLQPSGQLHASAYAWKT